MLEPKSYFPTPPTHTNFPARNVSLPKREASRSPPPPLQQSSSQFSSLPVRSASFDASANGRGKEKEKEAGRERKNSSPIDDVVQTALPDPK